MSFRRLIGLGVAAGGLVMGLAVPGTATAATTPPTVPHGCKYPPQTPHLSLVVSPLRTKATHSVTGAGTLVYGSKKCPIRQAVISLQRRPVVGGVPQGSFTTFTKTRTNSSGAYSKSWTVMKNQQIRAHFNRAGGFPPATSPTPYPVVRVRTLVTESAAKRADCKVHLAGGTRPVKADRVVSIQRRAAGHKFNGWTLVGKTRTNSKGHYSTTLTLNCGHTYNLSAKVSGDKVNLFGRSPVIFGIVPSK
jgi:hypothetical protein